MKPAHATSAEMALIGCLLIAPAKSTLYGVSADMFYDTRHRIVVSTINRLYDELDGNVGLAEIFSHLEQQNMLDTVGGVTGLICYGDCVPYAANAQYYADLIRDAYQTRTLQLGVDQLRRKLADGTANPNNIRDDLRTLDEEAGKHSKPIAIRVDQLVEQFPNLRPMLIDGLLRRGESMNLVSSTKVGKSWLSIGLALSLSTGRQWLGSIDTVKSKVLHIDTELHRETLAQRIQTVSDAMAIHLSGLEYHCMTVRGQNWSVNALGQTIAEHRPDVIVLDALYRAIPEDRDENSNREMALIYNEIDKAADRCGVGIILIHHATKGSQAGKATTDIGSGAGSMSRAVDTHATMTPSEEEGEEEVMILKAAVRSFPPFEPIPLIKSHPLWVPVGQMPTYSHGATAARKFLDEPVTTQTESSIEMQIAIIKRIIGQRGGTATRRELKDDWIKASAGVPMPSDGSFRRMLSSAVRRGDVVSAGKKPRSWYELPGNVTEF